MSKYYQNLFDKFINQNISPEELDQLLGWINQNEDFNDIEVLEKLWTNLETSEAIDKAGALRIQAILRNRIREEESKGRGKVVRLRPWWPRVAAGLALLLISGVGILYYLNSPVVIKSGFGEIVEVVLPDDSRVRLNANSQITYPRRWNSREVRKVSLVGEAFFEVTEDLIDHRKFVVKTKDLSVEVLGTEFNVNSRDASTTVFLESGSVKLNALNGKDTLVMVPGEEAGFDDSGSLSKLKVVNSTILTDWRDGSMVLKDQLLSGILREYENVFGENYGVLDKALLNQRFTITFPITDKDKALNILQNLIGSQVKVE